MRHSIQGSVGLKLAVVGSMLSHSHTTLINRVRALASPPT